MTGQGCEQPDLIGPALTVGLGLMTFTLIQSVVLFSYMKYAKGFFLYLHFKPLYVLSPETLSRPQVSSLLIRMICGTLLKAYTAVNMHYIC